MSTRTQPKQLIPFIGGRSLIQIAVDRLEGLVDREHRCICAGQAHRKPILERVSGIHADRFYGEPTARDTLNAVGFVAAVLEREDPEAVVAVFTADHLIEPVDVFRDVVERGYDLAERHEDTLVTFGIRPTSAATAYGYLELGDPIADVPEARIVRQFREKPDQATARKYLDAGPQRYLWNSGMFVWRAATLVKCIDRFAPDNHAGLAQIADAWSTEARTGVLEQVYPRLERVSVDYAVMEPASRDDQVRVATVPMPVDWLDVGSWPAYAHTCDSDHMDNAIGADRTLLLDTEHTLVTSSEPNHLIATIGVKNLVIVHTPDATLICHRDQAEKIKDLHKAVAEQHGEYYI
jgi:mannose-1-phosphate guanylyltransferase